MPPYSSDLIIGGANGRAVVAAPGWGIFVLGQCCMRDMSLAYSRPEQCDVSSALGGNYHVTHFGRPQIELTLRLLALEAEHSDTIPPDLRMAENMTVRELLGAAHRKLKERNPNA